MIDRERMTSDARGVSLIVPAAGDGLRLGLGIPKALVPIAGLPMLSRTLACFARCASISEIIVTAPVGYVDRFEAVLAEVVAASGHDPLVARVILGGATRQLSVELGLAAISTSSSLVCVHDAARPLVSAATIAAVIEAAARSGAATAASRPSDSVREEAQGGGSRALDRDRLWLIETPQAFARTLLAEAHEKARASRFEATDDAAIVERFCGAAVAIVPSDVPNFKVTTRADLELATLLLR